MADTELYDILEVTRNASDADIRRVRSYLIFLFILLLFCSHIIV